MATITCRGSEFHQMLVPTYHVNRALALNPNDTDVLVHAGLCRALVPGQRLGIVLLANGTEANHTPQERVGAARIVQMLAVCDAIVQAAADGGGG